MKESELRKCVDCAVCGKPFGSSGLPLFWRVTIERYGVDLRAVRRQDGLAAMLNGNSRLAQAMGADEDMATQLMTVKLTVCEPCAMEQRIIMLALSLAEMEPATEGPQT